MNNRKQKLLIIRLSAIGDVVHSTIIAQAIKVKHPDMEIHFLTTDFIAPILQNHPNIDKIIGFDDKKTIKLLYYVSLGLQLRKEKYDTIINLSNTFKNILISKLANSKRIVKRSKKRVHAVDAFFNTAVDAFGQLEKPTQLTLFSDKKIKKDITEKTKAYPHPFIIFSPGGENDNAREGRIWSDKKWIELGEKLNKKYNGTIFVIGSKSEKDYHKTFLQISNSVIFSGELSLKESVAIISIADLFISGDSGPLHIADALNVKTIGIMGSTSHVCSRPFGAKGNYIEPTIDCKYCGQKKCFNSKAIGKFKPCMESISSNEVFEFINKNHLL